MAATTDTRAPEKKSDIDHVEHAHSEDSNNIAEPSAVGAHHVHDKGTDAAQKELYATFAVKDAEWHARKKKELLRQVDFRCLPVLALMYTLNFLDRKYVHDKLHWHILA